MAACLLAANATADYQSGVAAYTRGEFEQALREWQQVIESPATDVNPFERAETFYAVAMLFWIGQGVIQDTSTSAGFLRQAAELNHSGAQSKLGYLFLMGQGVPANTFEAMKWLQMAARQGDTDAQYNLAVMYRDGIGVDANSELALQWFREAAANGDPVSAEVLTGYQRQGSPQAPVEPNPIMSANEVIDERQLSVGAGETRPAEPAPEPKAELAVAKKPEGQGTANPGMSEPSTHQVYDEQWILSRDPAHYTIQVIALKNLQSMNKLIDQHPELKPFAVYIQGEPHSPLYVLVQGDYSDIDEVRVGQKNFPESLSMPDQLWVRRFSGVQKLIKGQKQGNGEIAETSRAKD